MACGDFEAEKGCVIFVELSIEKSIRRSEAQENSGRKGRENLKAARKAAGMTQQQTADAVGISLRHYQNIEAGERNGNFAIWDKVEDLFGINQRELRLKGLEGSQ